MNTNLKLSILSALTLFGTVAQATSPVPPYLPKEPYQYRCDVTVVSNHYQRDSQEASKRYTSKTVMEFKNGDFFRQAEDVKWTHYVAESLGYMMGPDQPIADYPHTKDVYVGVRFDWPRDGVTKVNLIAGFALKDNGTTRSSRSVSRGLFGDKQISVSTESDEWTESTGTSDSKKVTAECIRVQ